MVDRGSRARVPGTAGARDPPGERPAGRLPVQFRVSGEHIDRVQAIARQVADKVRANPHVTNVNLDWSEPSKVVRLRIDQERARAPGRELGGGVRFLSGSLSGTSISTYREGNEAIEILLRGPGEERARLGMLGRWRCRPPAARRCRWSQVATLEDGSRTASSGIATAAHGHRARRHLRQGTAVERGRADRADAGRHPRRAAVRLPVADRRHGGGLARGQNSVNAGMPLFVLVV